MPANQLYYGDNLDVLRRHIDDESVDLVYLDPPFNSDQDYNVLFRERDGVDSPTQVSAFRDTWKWDERSELTFQDTVRSGGYLAETLLGFARLVGRTDMLAYLAMMAPRLVELKRVLKPTGSLYLHCDPTASHYLKLLLDAVFLPSNFRNEVVWKRTFAHGNVGRRYGRIVDSIFFYSRSERYTWNQSYTETPPDKITTKYPNTETTGGHERRWQSVTLRNPSPRPNLRFEYTASNGVTYHPHPNGWSCGVDRMRKYDSEGRLHFPMKTNGQLRLKMYEDESRGEKLQNLWSDIPPLAANAAERLGYPTQKPLALLERIIKTSSNPDDVVLDPFCGCGTSTAAAQQLGRRWIGIDVTHVAIDIIRRRMDGLFGLKRGKDYEVIGEPRSFYEASSLAAENPFQFQAWAVSTLAGRVVEIKKGKDRGVDGRLYFYDGGEPQQVIISVKSGNVKPADVRDLGGVIAREKAAIGVFVTLKEPTKEMRIEAARAGYYHSSFYGARDFPKMQIISVEAMFTENLRIKMPAAAKNVTAPVVEPKKKPKVKRRQPTLLDGIAE